MPFTIDRDALLTKLAELTSDTPDLSGINFGLLDYLVSWAEHEDEKKRRGEASEWDQGTWASAKGDYATGNVCGTVCCIAGKAIDVTPGASWAVLTNDTDIVSRYDIFDVSRVNPGWQLSDALVPEAMVPSDLEGHGFRVEVNGKNYYRLAASEAGRAILGLNAGEASTLFNGSNKLRDIKQIVSDIKSGTYRRPYNRSRFDVPLTDAPDREYCGHSAQDEVREIIGSDNTYRFYTTYGDCIGDPGHDGPHTYED